MPKVVKPKLVERKLDEIPTRQPEPKINVNIEPAGSAARTPVPINNEIKFDKSSSRLQGARVHIGAKLSIRYLNGPRAGMVAKFWFQKTTNDRRFEVDGYKSVGTDSPLGEVLESAQVDDIVSFTVRNEEIRVQVLEIRNT